MQKMSKNNWISFKIVPQGHHNCQLSIVNCQFGRSPLNPPIAYYHPGSVPSFRVHRFRYPLHMQPGVEKGFQGGADEKQHRGAGGGNGLRLPGVGALLPDIEPEMPV